MSYSVEQRCYRCQKISKCNDGQIIKNAVQGIIHQMPVGHLGHGTVTHQCHAFEDKNAPEPTAPTAQA